MSSSSDEFGLETSDKANEFDFLAHLTSAICVCNSCKGFEQFHTGVPKFGFDLHFIGCSAKHAFTVAHINDIIE